MRKSSRQLTAFLIFAFFAGSTAIADEIEITNGDRLSGEIVRHEVDSVRLKTSYAGTLEISWSDIVNITLNEPSIVLLKNGFTMEVEAFNRVEDEFVLQPVGASTPITISASSVYVIEPEAWELGQGHDFTGRVNVAIEDQSGNSEKNEFKLDFDLTNHWKKYDLRIFGDLEYDTTRGVTSTDNWSVMTTMGHTFRDKWFYAGAIMFQQDRFADLNLRTLGGPSIGYHFYDSKLLKLNFGLGPYYLKDDFIAQPDKSFWGPSWFLDYDQMFWKKRLQLYHRQIGFLSANGSAKFIWRSWIGLRIPIFAGLFGSVEYELDYDSKPAVESESTDRTFKLKLGYKW